MSEHRYRPWTEYSAVEKLNSIYKFYLNGNGFKNYSDIIIDGLKSYNDYIHKFLNQGAKKDVINDLLKDENDESNLIIALMMCVELHKQYFVI